MGLVGLLFHCMFEFAGEWGKCLTTLSCSRRNLLFHSILWERWFSQNMAVMALILCNCANSSKWGTPFSEFRSKLVHYMYWATRVFLYLFGIALFFWSFAHSRDWHKYPAIIFISFGNFFLLRKCWSLPDWDGISFSYRSFAHFGGRSKFRSLAFWFCENLHAITYNERFVLARFVGGAIFDRSCGYLKQITEM